MAKGIDLTGQKFGKLTALLVDHTHKKHGAYWLCSCECGNEAAVLSAHLRSGNTISCGCEVGGRLPVGETARNALYGVYIWSAKERGLSFNIPKSEFALLTKMHCHYCGAEPMGVKKTAKSIYVYNGIDRKDNSRGYEIDNVVPCCKVCNRAKNNMQYEKFIDWTNGMYEHLKTKRDAKK